MTKPIVVLLCILFSTTAYSGVGTCRLEDDPGQNGIIPYWPWYPPNTIISVYSSTASAPWTTIGMSQADFEQGLKRSLTILNEQYGSTVFLRYDGTTSALQLSGAVVVVGNVITCNAAYANTDIFFDPVHFTWKGSVIELRKFNSNVNVNCAVPQVWGTSELATALDVVGILNHELTHAVFDQDHPDSPTNPSCSVVGLSIMTASWEGRPARVRTMKQYDIESVQVMTGQRGLSSTFENEYRNADTNVWATAQSGGSSLHAIYRFGSIAVDPTASVQQNPRIVPFLANPNVSPYTGGGGLLSTYDYQDGWLWSFLNNSFSSHTYTGIATARKNGSSELILAYETSFYMNQRPYVAGSDFHEICYRRSSNGGQTWGSEQCGTPLAETGRYGLTATYDPYSDAFLIGFIADSYSGSSPPCYTCTPAIPDDYPYVAVLTIPATGSSTPAKTTVFTGQSYNAPSIACSGSASNGCVIVSGDTNRGCRQWYNAGVDKTTGVVIATGSYSQCYLEYDTPSVAYNATLGTFVLASTTSSDAIYSYKMPPGGTSWTGDGNIWDNGGQNYLSTAVITTTTASGDPNKRWSQAWWLQYPANPPPP